LDTGLPGEGILSIDLGEGERAGRVVLGSVDGGAGGNLKSKAGSCFLCGVERICSVGAMGLVAREAGRLARPRFKVSSFKLPGADSFGDSVSGGPRIGALDASGIISLCALAGPRPV
jgi:hypothetical protein